MSSVVLPSTSTLGLALTPQGHLLLRASSASLPLPLAVQQRIEAAFAQGPGAGLLHLGAREIQTALPSSLAYFRRLGRLYMGRLCALPDLELHRGAVDIPPPEAALAALAEAPPLMVGAEYLSVAVLAALWQAVAVAVREQLAAYEGTVQDWLQAQSPIWNSVGRICLHLAENKSDAERPFAFLATYAARLSETGQPQHLPLGRALQESARAGSREQLLRLLRPIQHAAEESALIRELADTRAIYAPQRWDAAQAYRFLREIPLLESKGLTVRVPAWWQSDRPPRPRVQVVVGQQRTAGVGLDALLSFSVEVAVDGDPLSDEEIAALLAGQEGLVLLRGRWVEVDADALDNVLTRWRAAERSARRSGLTLLEALRMLAGGPTPTAAVHAAPDPDWSQVTSGAWLREVLDQLRDPSRIQEQAQPGRDFLAALRPYQREGVQWLWLLSSLGLGACLADDMGLGKTIQVLALLSCLRQQAPTAPSLLIVPTSLIANWKAEIQRFLPSLRVTVAHPSERSAEGLVLSPETELVITTYGMVHRLEALAAPHWGLLILDEAQAIKNPSARRSRAIRQLRGRARIAMTGTPVENQLQDLWALFDFINPGLLGNAAQFKAFAKELGDDYAPLRRLISPYILRRLKRDPRIIQDLPDKTELKTYCGLTRVQAALYSDAVATLEAQLQQADDQQRRGVILAALMRFKQICDHPALGPGGGGDTFRPEDSGKIERLRELCEVIAQRQEKVLIFTQFRQMIEPLSRFLEGIFGQAGASLHGGTEVAQRAALVEAFQREDGPPFFVLSLRAGGTGLNLTAASHVIHFDRWWNPAVEDQATDRAYRIGQRRNVLVHKFICRGTIEEQIDRMIADKVILAGEIIGGDGDGAAARLTGLSNAELLSLVRLDIHTATAE